MRAFSALFSLGMGMVCASGIFAFFQTIESIKIVYRKAKPIGAINA